MLKPIIVINLCILFVISCSTDGVTRPVIVADLADPSEATFWDVPRYTPRPEFEKLKKIKNPISVWQNQSKTRTYRIDIDTGMLTIIESVKENAELITEKHIEIGEGAVGVIANREDTFAYVTNMRTGLIYAVDIEKAHIYKNLETGNKPYCLIFNKSQSLLYVASRFGDRVFVINPATFELVGESKIGDLDLEVKNNECATCHESREKGSHLLLHASNSSFKQQQQPQSVGAVNAPNISMNILVSDL